MPSLQSSLRFGLLENQDALKSLGLAPWLVVVGWMACAVLQEPLFLRQHGVNLSQEAAFVAWATLLLQFLLTKHRVQPRRCLALGLIGNWMLLVLIALGFTLTLLMVDCLRGQPLDSVGIIRLGSVFVLAWMPIAAASIALRPTVVSHLVLLIFLGWSMFLSAHLGKVGWTADSLASVSLSTIAAILLASAQEPGR